MKPGECHDSKGYPIYPGDLLRSPHFRGARRKMYFYYHVAVLREDGHMDMAPTCFLEPSMIRDGGGRCQINRERAESATILDGSGPGELLSFDERPRLESRLIRVAMDSITKHYLPKEDAK